MQSIPALQFDLTEGGVLAEDGFIRLNPSLRVLESKALAMNSGATALAFLQLRWDPIQYPVSAQACHDPTLLPLERTQEFGIAILAIRSHDIQPILKPSSIFAEFLDLCNAHFDHRHVAGNALDTHR